jgi:7-cyano-7-deazaguanine reductase
MEALTRMSGYPENGVAHLDETWKEAGKDLQQLGSGQTQYPTRPEDAVLETFDNKWPSIPYVVELECPEFTSLCPKTGQPDFAKFKILYIPNKKLIESKALKLYLFSFRNHGEFHESVTSRIAFDLYMVMLPHIIMVRGDFFPRGGISINPTVILPQETLPQYNKMIMDVWNHHEDGR